MEIPRSLIDARNAIERTALRQRNSISELENARAVLSRFIGLAAGPTGRGALADEVVAAGLVDAKASLERLAVKLAADADLGEPLGLLRQALAEIAAGDRHQAAVTADAAPPSNGSGAALARPGGQVFRQQPYQPPAAVRERAGR